jgi:hypothetical protein
MKRAVIFLLSILTLLVCAMPAFAADPITITNNKFVNNFRQTLRFQLEAQTSANKITQVALFIQLDGIPSSARQVPDFTPDKQIQATYEWRLTTNYLPPGVTGQYWWTLEDDAGNQLTTPKQNFRVEDAGKAWKKLSNAQLALYWYIGDDSFGKALFDRGVEAMKFLQQDTGVTVDKQIQTFIYGNQTDFRNALSVGAQEWTGGQAFPDYGIVLIQVAPGNLEWGKGATTHELTHQVIHQKIKSPLGDLSMPHWMDEGLAMYYETFPGELDSQFARPLQRAIQNDTVVALRTLSGNFPADSNAANLAYAQSYSVVDFIYHKYGKDKMAQLLQEFKKGGSYDAIFQQVLGVDTDGLDNAWRQDKGLKPRAAVTRSLPQSGGIPTVGLSTDYSTPDASAQVQPTATPRVVVQNSSQPAQPSSAPANPPQSIQICNGSMLVIVLGMVGAFWSYRKSRVLK